MNSLYLLTKGYSRLTGTVYLRLVKEVFTSESFLQHPWHDQTHPSGNSIHYDDAILLILIL